MRCYPGNNTITIIGHRLCKRWMGKLRLTYHENLLAGDTIKEMPPPAGQTYRTFLNFITAVVVASDVLRGFGPRWLLLKMMTMLMMQQW